MARGFPFECDCGKSFVFTQPERLGDPRLIVSIPCPFCGKRSLAWDLYERTVLSSKQLGVWALMSDLMEAGRALVDVGRQHHIDLSLPFRQVYAQSIGFEAMAGNLAAGRIAANVTNKGFDIGTWFTSGVGAGAAQVDLRWYVFGRSGEFTPEVWREFLYQALAYRERDEPTTQLLLAMIAWESWMNWTMLHCLQKEAATQQGQKEIRKRVKEERFDDKMQFMVDRLPEYLKASLNEESCRGSLEAGRRFRNDIVHGWVEGVSRERADATLSAVLRALYLTGSPLLPVLHSLIEGSE